MENLKQKIKNSRPARSTIIAIGFFIIIILGTLLLMLPFSTKAGESTTFLGALFTSTSATCVTGLVQYDTFTHWTLFGQLVIIILIQIGGLGFITFGVYAMMLMRKKIGLEDRELVHDSLNSIKLGGAVNFVKRIVKGTLIIEGIGALILSLCFIGEYGFFKGVYYGIFHSISAFCNAGFDLFGYKEKFCSLVPYQDDPVVILTISALIIIGGIGFAVWEDVVTHKLHIKKYQLHSKIVLSVTASLLVFGTLFFMYSENNTVLKDMSFGQRLLSSFFAAVTPRTAGFNSVDVASMSTAGKLLTTVLMFIGGSPGSTAGGVKTTTVVVIFLFILSYVKRTSGSFIFKRSISDDLIKKASTVFFINFTLITTAITIITLSQPLELSDVVLETVSAMSTVGMTSGITRDLTSLSQVVIILLMYCGRIGSLSFALSFSEKRKKLDIRYPTEDILIG